MKVLTPEAHPVVEKEVRLITGINCPITYTSSKSAEVTVPKSFLTKELETTEFEVSGITVTLKTVPYHLKTEQVDALLALLKEQGIKPEDTVISTTSLWMLHNPYIDLSFHVVYHATAQVDKVIDGITYSVTAKPVDFKHNVEYPEGLGGLGVLKSSRVDHIRQFNFYEKEQARLRQNATLAKLSKEAV